MEKKQVVITMNKEIAGKVWGGVSCEAHEIKHATKDYAGTNHSYQKD